MLKKSILTLSILCLSNSLLAETCPTINELKSHSFRDWQAYDIDNGTPVSIDRLNQFKTEVAQFALAEWMIDAPEGSGHCYYDGTEHDGRYLGLFLAKLDLIPDEKSDVWQNLSSGTMHCKVSTEACKFIVK